MPGILDELQRANNAEHVQRLRAVRAEARVAELKVDAKRLTEFVYRVIDSEGENFAEHCVKPPPDWIEEREPEKWKRAEEISARLRGEGGG